MLNGSSCPLRGRWGWEGVLFQLVTGSLITIHWTRLSVSFLCTQCIKIIVIVEFSFALFCLGNNSLVLLLLMLPSFYSLNFSNSFCACNKYLVPFHPTELQRISSLKLELKEFSVEQPLLFPGLRSFVRQPKKCATWWVVARRCQTWSLIFRSIVANKVGAKTSNLMKSRKRFFPSGHFCRFCCCQRGCLAAIGSGRRQLSKQIFRWKEIRRFRHFSPPPLKKTSTDFPPPSRLFPFRKKTWNSRCWAFWKKVSWTRKLTMAKAGERQTFAKERIQ